MSLREQIVNRDFTETIQRLTLTGLVSSVLLGEDRGRTVVGKITLNSGVGAKIVLHCY